MQFEPLLITDGIKDLIKKALDEDIQNGDATTEATITDDTFAHATVTAKQPGIVCGIPIFTEVFSSLDPNVNVMPLVNEGETVSANTVVIELTGPVSSLLKGERVALNFLGMMSGIATKTSEFVNAVSHTKCRITDTRKTLPLWRTMQKYAVRVGGGVNHRFGLYDMVLIKDNHIDSCGGIKNAIKKAKERWNGKLKIETETRNMDEVKEAIESGADRIMLDNMSLDEMHKAVLLIGDKAETEASGGITLDTAAQVAETGVGYISVGALTHSFTCMDYSMLLKIKAD